MRDFTSELRPALLALAILTAITGLLYPLVVMGVAKVVFPHQADGSLVERGNRVVGSSLIGQTFTDPGYFWGRPSATTDADGKPSPYNGLSSGADNLGPTNRDLADAVAKRITDLRAADPGNVAPVPVDLVTTSASGLDPELRAIVDARVVAPSFGLFGDPRVTVLDLNLALDAAHTSASR
jgi:K+-transporting ATPase ATPase C chain